MLGLLGKKLGQTSVYNAQGVIVPVTIVRVGPNRVLQTKTQASDGYNAVQLGFDDQKEHRVTKGLLGHFKKYGATPTKRVREFRDFTLPVKPGDVIGAGIFAQGDFVDAIGITKGRGFEGVMKRHRFRGGDASHGAKGFRRRSGAIGQRLFPGTVMRGMKMPGHMGQVRRTAQNLQIIQVREADNLLLIKGAIPGSNNDYVIIREAKKLPKGSERAKRKLASRTAATEAPAPRIKGAAVAAKPAAAAAAKPAPAPVKAEAKKQ
jgi:large subunit ribosomal protein L3